MYYINEEVAAAAAAATAASAGQRFPKNTWIQTLDLTQGKFSYAPNLKNIYFMTYLGIGIPSKGLTWKVLSDALLFRVAHIWVAYHPIINCLNIVCWTSIKNRLLIIILFCFFQEARGILTWAWTQGLVEVGDRWPFDWLAWTSGKVFLSTSSLFDWLPLQPVRRPTKVQISSRKREVVIEVLFSFCFP